MASDAMVKSSSYSHRTGGKAKSTPVLREISVSRATNGGFSAKHMYDNSGMDYHPPQEHVFGADQGSQLVSHLTKHLGIKGIKPKSADQKARTEAEEEAEGE